MLPETASPARNRLGWCAFIIAAAVIGFFTVREANAQAGSTDNTEQAPTAKTQVITRPSGALVFLQGEYELAGRAPYTISHLLRGTYRIKARSYGYENWSNEFNFTGRGNEKLAIRLSPKTRPKAAYRSMLFPGWGQYYSDQPVKGIIIAAAQAGALGVLIRQSLRYNDVLDDFNRAAAAFEQGKNDLQNRPALQAALQAAQTRLDDQYESRRRWALLSASVYVYNLIDVLLFFPSYQRSGMDLSLTVSPPEDFNTNGAQVGVQARF